MELATLKHEQELYLLAQEYLAGVASSVLQKELALLLRCAFDISTSQFLPSVQFEP
jgi:hypothetical protein